MTTSTPVSPFVRARIRTARGLDPRAVLVCTPAGATWSGRAVARAQLPSALGLAAVVAVTDPTALEPALSWGAPVVTTPELAAAIGAVPGRDVLVATDPAREVHHVLGDEQLAARLSRSGRALFARRHPREPAEPGGLEGQLEALGTPPGAFIVDRVAAAVGALPGVTARRATGQPVLPEPLRAAAAGALEPDAVPPRLPRTGRTPTSVARGIARRVRGAVTGR